MDELQGRIAVVTGAAGGLGRAIADRLAQSGASIVAIDTGPALEQADLPADWRAEVIDLGADDALARQKALAEALDAVDIVVANAGLVPPWRGVAELDAREWQRVMAVNVWGVAATLGGFADALARTGRGAAVLMASINGYKAHPKQMLYTTSKHAVIGIMRTAALDLGPQGTRVNALAPGPIATEALLGRLAYRHGQGGPAPDTALAGLVADTALRRIATPEQVAEAAHFLASDAAAGITGVVLPVEAGLG
jgi:NAD(P)-dependent dehydrogenase (short-subunit alcohol dehydrogenase family)